MHNLFFFTAILILANAEYTHGSPVGSDDQKLPDVKNVYLKIIKEDQIYVNYVKNFTELMSTYMKSKNNKLRPVDVSDIQNILERFILTFTYDLQIFFDNNKKNIYKVVHEESPINDDVPEKTYTLIKGNMKKEFPTMSEKSVDLFIKRLRKNVFNSRRHLEEVVLDAEHYATENSSMIQS